MTEELYTGCRVRFTHGSPVVARVIRVSRDKGAALIEWGETWTTRVRAWVSTRLLEVVPAGKESTGRGVF